MNYVLKTTVLAATACVASLAFLPAASALDERYYPPETLYRLPNGSLAVNPALVGPTYGITAPGYRIVGPNYVGPSYGITAPAYRVGPNYVGRSYGITPPAYRVGPNYVGPSFGISDYYSRRYISPRTYYTPRRVVIVPRARPWWGWY